MKIQDFYKHLKNNLDDWEYRSVFADWLFEHNNPLEKAQRWMIEQKKHPYRFMHLDDKRLSWIWGKIGNLAYCREYKCSLIEHDLIDQMIDSFNNMEFNSVEWRYFTDLPKAELELARIL